MTDKVFNVDFCLWFKNNFGRTPNSHNENDLKMEEAWIDGFNIGVDYSSNHSFPRYWKTYSSYLPN